MGLGQAKVLREYNDSYDRQTSSGTTLLDVPEMLAPARTHQEKARIHITHVISDMKGMHKRRCVFLHPTNRHDIAKITKNSRTEVVLVLVCGEVA